MVGSDPIVGSSNLSPCAMVILIFLVFWWVYAGILSGRPAFSFPMATGKPDACKAFISRFDSDQEL